MFPSIMENVFKWVTVKKKKKKKDLIEYWPALEIN